MQIEILVVRRRYISDIASCTGESPRRFSELAWGKGSMHRQVCEGFSCLDRDRLPSRNPDGRLRLLVLSLEALGGRTYNRQLEHYTATREDVDAVHVRIHPGLGVRVLARKLQLGRLTIGGATPTAVWCRTLWRPLCRLLESGRFDAVHATRQGTALAAARLRSRHRFAFSVTMDSTVPLYAAMVDGAEQGIDADEAAIFGAADLIAPYSQWVARSLVDDYDVNASKIQIVRPAPPPALRQTKLPPRPHQPLRMFFVGHHYQSKGWHRLLHWHQTRWADRAELHVVSDRIRMNPHARNVVWHGDVPYQHLQRELLPSADLFVLPTYTDTYGQVFAKALCSGIPRVGTRQAAIPEIIEDGVTGYTCDRDDDESFIRAVERLLGDPGLRARMSAASLTRAARLFDTDQAFNLFLDRVKETASIVAAGRSTRVESRHVSALRRVKVQSGVPTPVAALES